MNINKDKQLSALQDTSWSWYLWKKYKEGDKICNFEVSMEAVRSEVEGGGGDLILSFPLSFISRFLGHF